MSNSKKLKDIPFSILDLSSIAEGKTATDALNNSLKLAQHAEKLGYNRFWVAEHHNIAGIASSATSVLIGYLAGGTKTIRVGSGGVMLPNHAPLVIAEQFGTLEALYPNRIDLGLGRAPGTDQLTSMALRRDPRKGMDFPDDVAELQSYFAPSNEQAYVKAIPGEGQNVPIWLLGSSTYSAQLAAELGLPFSFASHFAPTQLMAAINIYRDNFKPSDTLSKPHVMVAVNAFAADTVERAEFLATSHYQKFLGMIRGNIQLMQPPVEDMDSLWSPQEKRAVQSQLRYSLVGDKDIIQEKLQKVLDDTQADEIMINSDMFHQEDRLRSLEIIAELKK